MPHGLLLPKVLWSAYIGIQGLTWTKDARCDGGILSISPYYDGGYLDEIVEPSGYIDDLVQLRQHLIQGDLGQKAEKLMAAKAKRAAEKNEEQRKKRMQEMVKEPNKWLLESEKLADARGIDNYKMAAELLFDLREAVGGEKGEKIAKAHAAHLAKKHPTLSQLKSSLRKRGLLD